jgi:tRNA A-37 threonylcarbamoyl transferase component Bud32
MPLAPGEHFGRYTILALVGQGGMGIVYRAHDTHLDRTVALKVLRADEQADAAAKEDVAKRLLREGRAAAAIQHPNAVAIFDVGEWEGTPFLAMELVDGKTLRAYVESRRLSIAYRVRWLIDIASALAAAHKRGVVHRDVKPENVIVGEDSIVKVLDFGIARRAPEGIAKIAGAAAGDSTVFGSPRYMAPEQLRGEALDGRTDQFAWGILAFELLTGRHPWADATTDLELTKCILGRPLPRPSEWDARLPNEIDEVVARAVQKQSEQRYPSMESVIAQLRRIALPDDPVVEAEHEEAASSPTPSVNGIGARFGRTLRGITTRTFGMTARSSPGAAAPALSVRWAVAIAMLAAIALIVAFVSRGGRHDATTSAGHVSSSADAAAPASASPEATETPTALSSPTAVAVVDASASVAKPARRIPQSTRQNAAWPGTRATGGGDAVASPSPPTSASSEAKAPTLNTEW